MSLDANLDSAPSRSAALKAAGLLALGGFAAVLYLVFAAGAKLDASGYGRFATGALVGLTVSADAPAQPATTFKDAQGNPHTLADWRGQVVVLNLWASWCAPCIEEMPSLAALQARFGDQGLVVVPVSVDRELDGPDAARQLADLSGEALPFLQDASYAIAYDTKARGFPTTILYGRDGREIARMSRGADWASPEAFRLIEAALAEPAPTLTTRTAQAPAAKPAP